MSHKVEEEEEERSVGDPQRAYEECIVLLNSLLYPDGKNLLHAPPFIFIFCILLSSFEQLFDVF